MAVGPDEAGGRRLGLVPYGLSFHPGSQQTGPDAHRAAIGQVAMLFDELEQDGIKLGHDQSRRRVPHALPGRDHPDPPISARASSRALQFHFENDLPEVLLEPGRYLVGDAGVLESEVVLVSQRSATDPLRWVYLDIGRFGGLAETEDESTRYRITTPHDGGPTGAGDHRRADLRQRRHAVRAKQQPFAAGA